MPTFTIKSLGMGTLQLTPSSIYTVPASTSAIIKAITLVNIASTSVTVNLALSGVSTSAYILPPSYSLDGYGMIEATNNLTMGPGQSISGWAGSISAIQYTVHGTEQY